MITMMKRLGCLVLGACVLAGCIPEDETDPFEGANCDPATTVEVGGLWTLEGEGARTSCEDDRLNVNAFSLGLANAVSVTQREDPANMAQILELGTPIGLSGGGSFLLNGDISGSCVTFATEERGPDGMARVLYRFQGTYEATDVIEGSFTGEGPGSCTSEGTFRVVPK